MSEGWRWDSWQHATPARSTIQVIERPSETYEQFRQRRNREEEERPRKVPFGFGPRDEERPPEPC